MNFLDLLDSFNLKQKINSSTHELGGILDLLITTTTDITKDIELMNDRMGSDHYPIKFSIDCEPTYLNEFITIRRRKYKAIDLELFKIDL